MTEGVTTSLEAIAYVSGRFGMYPKLSEQLDSIWHDIDDGKFGDDAKTGSFYTMIKTVKDAHPKPS